MNISQKRILLAYNNRHIFYNQNKYSPKSNNLMEKCNHTLLLRVRKYVGWNYKFGKVGLDPFKKQYIK